MKRLFLLITWFLLTRPVYAADSTIKLGIYDPDKPATTARPGKPGIETCTTNFPGGEQAMASWFYESLSRIWLFTGGLNGTAPNQSTWVAEKKELYLGASEKLFGARSTFMARAILKLQITMNYPGRPAPVGRVQIPQGYTVTEQEFRRSYQKTYDTLASLSCSERVSFIQPSTGTPLLVYTSKETPLTIHLGNHTLFSGTIYPDGQFRENTEVKTQLDYDYPILRVPLPIQRQTIPASHLEEELGRLMREMQLNTREQTVYLHYLQGKIPQANAYTLGIYTDKEASQLLPLSIHPSPQALYRIIMYVRPWVSKPERDTQPIHPSIVVKTRDQLTIVDMGVVIDW